jgi:hypothetical protein
MNLSSIWTASRLAAKASWFPWALLAAIALLGASSTAGFVAGAKWETGHQAKLDNAALKANVAALNANAKSLQQNAVNQAAATADALVRMNAIAATLENQNAASQEFERRQASSLASLLRIHPDLARAHLGTDVLQHWNDSNQGNATAAPAAATGTVGKPDAAVPKPAAGARRHPGGAVAKPRPGNSPVPPLRQYDGSHAGQRGRVPEDGMALVLQRAQGHWS